MITEGEDSSQKRARLRELLASRLGKKSFPLSVGQQALAYIHRLAPESWAYHVVLGLRCREPLETAALLEASEALLRRHDSLRARLLPSAQASPQQAKAPRQKIGPAASVTLLEGEELSEGEVQAHLRRSLETPFDLAQEPPVRWQVIRRAPDDHLLLWVFHHIAVDFWSLGLLLEEMDTLLRGKALGPAGAPYGHFVERQRELLEGPSGAELRRYWKERLGSLESPLELPLDRPRPAEQSFRGATIPLRFEAEEAAAAKALGRLAGATLFATLLAVLQILLRRWTGQRDFAVATPVAQREAPFEKTVGYFVHQVAIRGDRGLASSFREVLEQVRDRSLEAVEHCALPFSELVTLLELPRDPSRAPLCDVGFALETSRMDRRGIFPILLGESGATMDLGGKGWQAVELPQQEGQLDLNLHLLESQGSLAGLVAYDTALFDETTIQRFLGQYRRLLSSIAADPGRPVGDLPLLSREESEELLALGSPGASAPVAAAGSSLVEEVLRQCRQRPEAPAVEGAAGSLTYRQLEIRSAALARRLEALGVGPEVAVGVLEEPSLEMVVAWLGVLWAGGAYMPLDPRNPPGRLREMLGIEAPAGAGKTPGPACRVLLSRKEVLRQALGTGEASLEGPGGESLPVVFLEGLESLEGLEGAGETPEPLPVAGVDALGLANIIFTSGSTGRPKAVAVPRGALHNVVRWNRRLLSLGPEDRVPNILRPGFDPAALEVWGTLTSGATLVIPEAEDRVSGRPLARWLTRQRITAMTAPAPLGESLLAAGIPEASKLRCLVLGGEALKVRPAGDLALEVHNHYGPTETAIVAAGGPVEPRGSEALPSPHVGRPVDGVGLEILDRRLRRVPRGVVGEVCIRGAGVSRGYPGSGALTAEAFVPDPASVSFGGRIYRTGDLGRWGNDGNLYLLGRKDQQVKIRGHRIELEEIERRLQALPPIQAAAVAVHQPGTAAASLSAYAISSDLDEAPDPRSLLSALAEHLPEYMVPSRLIFLENFPLTANGKVDRAALPAPEASETPGAAESSPKAPLQGELEETIAGAWGRVLDRREIPPTANFFDLGGNSLLLGEVLGLLEEALDLSLNLVELLRYPTVRSLAAHLRGPQEATPFPAPAESPEGGGAPRPPKGAEPIAVLGMAGRFPGAGSTAQLWRLLEEGREGLRTLEAEELAASGVSSEAVADPRFVAIGGPLEGIEEFDAGFFGLNPREAEILDPQQRIFLECAWQALEDGGYVPGGDDRTGVFAGAGKSGYQAKHLEGHEELMRSVGEYQLSIANEKDFLATRVAYRLNLKGPAVNVQTACSTSLVAVHLACQSLRAGECDMALAGGVTLRLPQASGYRFEEGMILSEDGRCRPFSDAATGTVGGNGAGVLLLKPLARALADGDPIRGVLRGSAINNDGSLKAGFTAPTVEGQSAVIRQALAVSGVSPEEISYVEAHGTATQLGDPIEVEALHGVFGGVSRKILLGSVKSNLGHLDAAAGVTGLIKTLLALEEEQLPPTLHFEAPNPNIDFSAGPFEVAKELRPWPRKEAPRRAGVSSFGIGGTNAHVIVEEAPQLAAGPPEGPPVCGGAELLVLSGRSREALIAGAEKLGEFLHGKPAASLEEIAWTLQTGRKAFEHRGAWVLREGEDPGAAVGDPARGRRGLVEGGEGGTLPVVQLFPGQGAQHPGMGRELYETFPVYRKHLDHCHEILEGELRLNLLASLHASPEDATAADRLRETDLAQPSLFAVSSALAALWDSLGLEAGAMIGHSIGEWVAAYRAGVFDLETALKLVAARGRLIRALPAGAMLSVPLGEEELQPWLTSEVALAAVNGPSQGVLSGPSEAIAETAQRLQEEGVEVRPLHTSHAFHSPMMDPCLGSFREVVQGAALNSPGKAFVSTVTGEWIRPEEAMDPEYWVRQLRSTVRFSKALATAAEEYGSATFLECGPGRALSTFARGTVPGGRAVSVLPHAKSDTGALETFLGAVGDLWIRGQHLEWRALHGSSLRRRSLPGYEFQKERFWVDPPDPAEAAARKLQPPQAGPRLFRPFWRTVPPAGRSPRRERQRWLFLEPRRGMGKALAAAVEASGGEARVATGGTSLRELSSRELEFLPGQEGGLLKLLEDSGYEPQRVVFSWPAVNTPGGASEEGFFALLSWIEALREAGFLEGLTSFDAVTLERDPWGSGPCRPAAALPEALLRTLGMEVPGISCRAVRWPRTAAAEEADEGAGSELLLKELEAEETAETVFYAGGQRLLPGWEELETEKPPSEAPAPVLGGGLKKGGAYLITGGLGGLGLELAERFARHLEARLILLSRRPLPEGEDSPEDSPLADAVGRISALRKAGSEVMTAAVDVTDSEAVREILREARRRFRRIDGVVHCAGVAGGGLLEARKPEDFRRVLAPKVTGTEVLAAALEDVCGEDLPDFFVLSSSLASSLTLPGQAGYAAANAFLDAFAETSPLPSTVAIQWDYWRGVGMAAGALPAGLEKLRQGPGLTAEEGWKAFCQALGTGTPRLAVAAFDLPRAALDRRRGQGLGDLLEPSPEAGEEAPDVPSGTVGAHPRPDLGTSFVAPRSGAEERLAQIWGRLLGIDPIGIHDDFFELGGHSLLGTRLMARIEDAFGVRLPLAKLFQLPTVAALAAQLERQPAPRKDPRSPGSSPGPGTGNLGGEGQEGQEGLRLGGSFELDPDELSDEAVAELLASLAPEEAEV